MFAVCAGADPNVVYDVITHGAGNSLCSNPACRIRSPVILGHEHSRDFHQASRHPNEGGEGPEFSPTADGGSAPAIARG